MTAFTTAQLPGGIYACTTVEQLHIWSGAVLQFNNSTDAYTEAEGTSRLFHFIQPQIRIPDKRLVVINRAVLQINESAAQNLPIWKRVNEFSNTIIPDAFKITG